MRGASVSELFFHLINFFWFSLLTSGPTTNIPSRKKCTIVQQTKGITDSIATCINVHTIDLHICTIVFAVEH